MVLSLNISGFHCWLGSKTSTTEHFQSSLTSPFLKLPSNTSEIIVSSIKVYYGQQQVHPSQLTWSTMKPQLSRQWKQFVRRLSPKMKPLYQLFHLRQLLINNLNNTIERRMNILIQKIYREKLIATHWFLYV